jgi:hypothetical protein
MADQITFLEGNQVEREMGLLTTKSGVQNHGLMMGHIAEMLS